MNPYKGEKTNNLVLLIENKSMKTPNRSRYSAKEIVSPIRNE
jgi:hypothetical protein